ncbi:hypothetical protein LDENG_00215840 [Lucifuga dentata]|nr:hypothetical protein LDENG_00215840 [Lucifuga dentata]
MESDSWTPESEAQLPDNRLVESLDTSGFKETADRMEQLLKNTEVLLSDVEQLRSHCSQQAAELIHAAVDLRQQQEELKESYTSLARDMQEIMDAVDELFSNKSDFDAKKKQAQELNGEGKWFVLFGADSFSFVSQSVSQHSGHVSLTTAGGTGGGGLGLGFRVLKVLRNRLLTWHHVVNFSTSSSQRTRGSTGEDSAHSPVGLQCSG